jgi:hypothetical protein
MSDYDQGMSDCQSGIPARDNASDEYIEGYGCVYECDAIHAHAMEKFNMEYAAI